MRTNKIVCCVMSLMLIIPVLLSACQTATQAPTQVPVATTPANTGTVAPTQGPQVGGNFIMAFQAGVDSLDPTKAASGLSILQWINASLLAQDPTTGQIVPYLAESWTISPDGLTYTFTLRNDVRFQDGTPLTAQDYVWTIQRILDPATQSYCGNFTYTGTTSVAVVDTHTFTITLGAPNYYFLNNLTFPGCAGPVSEAYATKVGDTVLAQKPNGVGPFMLDEWVPGVKVVLQRNPDFTWGPAYTHGGPAYLQTIEYRIVTDSATQLAAVESNEVQWAGIDVSDVSRIQQLGTFNIANVTLAGSVNSLIMNTSHSPLDDIRVRQAINMAIDIDVLIQVVANGAADPMNGAISSTTTGYCSDAESLSYSYNLDQAKALMQQAGYAYNSDGLLEKDGLTLVMSMPYFGFREKLSTILAEQLKALGITVNLSTADQGTLISQLASGDFDLFAGGLAFTDTSVLNYMFNSAFVGTPLNASSWMDPTLDQKLTTMVTTTDSATNLETGCDVQKYVAQNAITVPLYADKMYAAVSNTIAGVRWVNPTYIDLFDAYFVNP